MYKRERMPAGGADDGLPYNTKCGLVAGFFDHQQTRVQLTMRHPPSPTSSPLFSIQTTAPSLVLLCVFTFSPFYSSILHTHRGIDREHHDM
jgi:hypothetical protein